jgi:hypothetical protein
MTDEDVTTLPKRRKGVYIGAPACFLLEREGHHLRKAFCDPDGPYDGLYVVGSSLERPDWRDVDVRLMLSDENFAKLFPDAGRSWEFDPRWLLMTAAISRHLSVVTGLPIDFQFQPTTHANEMHHGPRNALGLDFARFK